MRKTLATRIRVACFRFRRTMFVKCTCAVAAIISIFVLLNWLARIRPDQHSLLEQQTYTPTLTHVSQVAQGPSLSDLLRLTSTFDQSKVSEVTVVLLPNPTYNGLEEQLSALFNQTITPSSVWVCLSHTHTTLQTHAERMIREWKALYNWKELQTLAAPHEFTDFTRFQMAFQAGTKYVWLLDDDVLPSPRTLELLLHTMSTNEYKGVLGTQGWLMPPPTTQGLMLDYSDVSVSGSIKLTTAHIQEVDALCGSWFMETQWLRYLFAEVPPDPPLYAGGSELMLSYALRKYANIRTYVLPTYTGQANTLAHELFFIRPPKPQEQDKNLAMMRKAMFYGLVQRGADLYHITHRPHTKARCLLYLDPAFFHAPKQAQAFHPLLFALKGGGASDYTELSILLPGTKRWDCARMLKAIGLSSTAIQEYCSGSRFGLYTLNFATLSPNQQRDYDITTHLNLHVPAILDTLQPDYVFFITGEERVLVEVASDTMQRPTTPPPESQILESIGNGLRSIVRRRSIPMFEIRDQDSSFFSWLLSMHPVVVKGFFCRPPLTPLLHAGDQLSSQLQQIKNLHLNTHSSTPVESFKALPSIMMDDIESAELVEMLNLAGWTLGNVNTVHTHDMDAFTRAGIAKGGTTSNQTLTTTHGFGAGVNPIEKFPREFATQRYRLSAATHRFLSALRSFHLERETEGSDEHVLYVADTITKISPGLFTYLAGTLYLFRSDVDAEMLTAIPSSQERLDPKMHLGFNVTHPYDPSRRLFMSSECSAVHQRYTFREHQHASHVSQRYKDFGLWFIPLKIPTGAGAAADTNIRLSDDAGLSANVVDTTKFSSMPYSGLYPPHVWRALQEGLTEAERRVKSLNPFLNPNPNPNPNPNAQANQKGVEDDFMRSVLTYACQYYHRHTNSSNSDCRLVEIGLSLSGSLALSPLPKDNGWGIGMGVWPNDASTSYLVTEDDVMSAIKWTV